MADVNIYDMAQAWNNVAVTFTAMKMDVTDTASAAASKLIDLLVSGASKFNVDKAGIVTFSAPNAAAADTQSGYLQVKDYGSGVTHNNVVLGAGATGAPNIRLQVDDATAHIGLNIGGTAQSAFTVMRSDGANELWLELRSEDYQTTGFGARTLIYQYNDGFKISPNTGYMELNPQTSIRMTNAGYVAYGTPTTPLLTQMGSKGVAFSMSDASVSILSVEQRAASASGGGAFLQVVANDGAALASGHRLGGLNFFGSESSNSIALSGVIQAFATEAWSGSAHGTRIAFQNVANTTVSRLERFGIEQNGLITFGDTTSAGPALKRSSTVLQARLADDSDFASVQGKLRAHANAAAETPTATHTLRVFDAAGTEYKVLAIAA